MRSLLTRRCDAIQASQRATFDRVPPVDEGAYTGGIAGETVANEYGLRLRNSARRGCPGGQRDQPLREAQANSRAGGLDPWSARLSDPRAGLGTMAGRARAAARGTRALALSLWLRFIRRPGQGQTTRTFARRLTGRPRRLHPQDRDHRASSARPAPTTPQLLRNAS